MIYTENIERIKMVNAALEELAKDVVFVGGATVSLYADRPAGEIRPTEDVDILTELIHYGDYVAIEVKLREKGFTNDQESGIICRYKVNDIVVDIMPTNGDILGFTNQWYTDGFRTAMNYEIDKDCSVKIFQPAYFLASKIAAFNSRGKGDGRFSPDFEDIVFMLNNRTTIWQELQETEISLSNYLKEQFSVLLRNKYIDEWISANLEYNERKRVKLIIERMEAFAKE